MIIFGLKLLLAHLLGDFVFQPDKWVEDKKINKERSPYLYLHIAIHAVLLLVMLQFNLIDWEAIVIILVSHFIIDLAKLHLQDRWNGKLLFVLDQLLHLLVILLVVYLCEPFQIKFGWVMNIHLLLLLIALVMVSYVAGVVMKLIMGSWKLVEDNDNDSLKNAGKYIGILERLFVFVFIVLDQWGAIGLLIAAKSVLRFNDLSQAKDRKLTEYILIGTLLSIGLAMAIGLLYKYFLLMLE